MTAGSLLFWLAILAAPVIPYALLVWQKRAGKLRVVLGTFALGAVAYVPTEIIERSLEGWTGLHSQSTATSDLAVLVYAFLVVAPLEQGAKVAAVAPVWRSRYFHEPIDGIVYASAGALGFITAHNAVFLWGADVFGIDAVRALLAVPAHLFFAAAWGYALGRDPQKRVGGRLFNVFWLAATFFNGVYDHLAFARGPTALWATAPILLCIGFVLYVAARDLLRRGAAMDARPPSSTQRFFRSIAPPSINAMREALRSTDRPVMITWIGFGALVTTGVITASLAGAVAIGHELGIDFASVDRVGARSGAASPLVLLGGAALAAFPIAGYLVARASATRTVLEPAMAAGLAIAGSLILLGLAAPVAVVFAIAFAPIAFGLACAGAWMGLKR